MVIQTEFGEKVEAKSIRTLRELKEAGKRVFYQVIVNSSKRLEIFIEVKKPLQLLKLHKEDKKYWTKEKIEENLNWNNYVEEV